VRHHLHRADRTELAEAENTPEKSEIYIECRKTGTRNARKETYVDCKAEGETSPVIPPTNSLNESVMARNQMLHTTRTQFQYKPRSRDQDRLENWGAGQQSNWLVSLFYDESHSVPVII